MAGGFPKPEKLLPPSLVLTYSFATGDDLDGSYIAMLGPAAALPKAATAVSGMAHGFPEAIQRLVGHFPRFWGTVTPRPRIWYPGDQLLEGIDRRDAGGRHRGRVGSCRLRPKGDSEARPARGGSRGARSWHQFDGIGRLSRLRQSHGRGHRRGQGWPRRSGVRYRNRHLDRGQPQPQSARGSRP